jgi:hypothetical protein
MTTDANPVSIVAVVAGETMLATGRLVDRDGGVLQVAFDHDVQMAPGSALVVVVHGQPDEVLLAIGLAADATTDATGAVDVHGRGSHATMQRTQRLRVVERRD